MPSRDGSHDPNAPDGTAATAPTEQDDESDQSERPPASHVTLSYPSELSTWGRNIVEDDPFRAYLPKAHDRARPGDVWEEFVGVGCCGDALDVALRVESVAGGNRLTSSTTFEFTVRDACVAGGWDVQSEASPE